MSRFVPAACPVGWLQPQQRHTPLVTGGIHRTEAQTLDRGDISYVAHLCEMKVRNAHFSASRDRHIP
ncbi:MAG: hypothetical protein H6672_20405 [Anaerolineaceae bacterium]|nr:hypothetical protein [Anaerolineaceae bacterium]